MEKVAASVTITGWAGNVNVCAARENVHKTKQKLTNHNEQLKKQHMEERRVSFVSNGVLF